MHLFLFILLLIGLAVLFIMIQNTWISTSRYSLSLSRCPQEMNDFKIVHLSDIHGKRFTQGLLKKIVREKPDAIFITGDLIDRNRIHLDRAIEFARQLPPIASTYFVSGNHETLGGQAQILGSMLQEVGVLVLDNEAVKWNETTEIIGLSDSCYTTKKGTYRSDLTKFKEAVEKLHYDDMFTLVLSHHPEFLNLYHQSKFDVVFSGHAHGGLIHLPFFPNGLFAPGQGIFPDKTRGVHQCESTHLVISRGLGNSGITLRCFNRPELVVVTLRKE